MKRRGVGGGFLDIFCPGCRGFKATAIHLFFTSEFFSLLWRNILSLLGLQEVLAPSIPEWFIQFRGLFKGKVQKRRGMIIWIAAMWTIWLARNSYIFNSNNMDLIEVIDLTKTRSWMWMTTLGSCNASFGEWCVMCMPTWMHRWYMMEIFWLVNFISVGDYTLFLITFVYCWSSYEYFLYSLIIINKYFAHQKKISLSSSYAVLLHYKTSIKQIIKLSFLVDNLISSCYFIYNVLPSCWLIF